MKIYNLDKMAQLTFFVHTQTSGAMLNFLRIKRSLGLIFARSNSSQVLVYADMPHRSRSILENPTWYVLSENN